MKTPISYLICTTERTGSYLLCDALTLTGIAGRPQECFHPALLRKLPAPPDDAAYFEQIAQGCTTPNGVFGAKVHWCHMRDLVLRLREHPEYHGIGAGELLQSWLPNARYIRLTRRDKVRQAVSHLRAIQSNTWWEMTPWTDIHAATPKAQTTFDPVVIERLIYRIHAHEAAWQLLFEDCGIQPLDLVYEDFAQEQLTTTLHVLAELQIPTPPDLPMASPRYKKQADDTSEQWVRHYHELRGAQAAHAWDTAPIHIAQVDRDILSSHRPILAVLPRPLLQPHTYPERVLRMVVYSAQPSDELPALLARGISQDTGHTAHCVWYPPSRDLPCEEGTLDAKADPVSAAAALAAADVVLIHDGEVAPRHSAMLKDKALVILAHHPHAQHSPWLGLGFPGVLLDPLLAELPAFQDWPHLALPWGSPHDWDRLWMPLIARALPPADPHGRVFHRSAGSPSLPAG